MLFKYHKPVEIAIKLQLGKIILASNFNHLKNIIKENNIAILPLEFEHLLELIKLPNLHKDLFDRIIIAQSISKDLILISKDQVFVNYPIKLIHK